MRERSMESDGMTGTPLWKFLYFVVWHSIAKINTMGHRALAIISSYLAGFIQVQDEMTRLLTVSAASTLSSHDSALLQRTLYMSYPCLGTLGFIIQSLSIDEAILVVPDSDVSHQLFPPSSLSVSRCPCSCCLLVWDWVVSSAFIGNLFLSPIGLAICQSLVNCLGECFPSIRIWSNGRVQRTTNTLGHLGV